MRARSMPGAVKSRSRCLPPAKARPGSQPS